MKLKYLINDKRLSIDNINIVGLMLYPTKYLDHLFNLDLI